VQLWYKYLLIKRISSVRFTTTLLAHYGMFVDCRRNVFKL